MSQINNNIKNLIGWRTRRKIVVLSVDDYGNVRLDSKKARENMDKAGMRVYSRFDALDTLETRQDLEMLFETLHSVKDKNGHSAIFTPFSLPCNINFEQMAYEDFKSYKYEMLPETYEKLSIIDPHSYNGAWDLWKEGIKSGIMVPQFHGREHINLKVFVEKLQARDPDVLTSLRNRSFTSISDSGYSTISNMAAFDFWDINENKVFDEIITDGLNAFEKVYGYRSVHFNPPGGREHPIIHKSLEENGIKFLDTPFIKQQHQGRGKYKRILNYTGKRNSLGMIYEVRNVVFEPTVGNRDWVALALSQIEAAFRWNRPAIISSHRVNFCGHIDPENRRKGIRSLKDLLIKIVLKWPSVEFMPANKLGEIIRNNK